MKAVERSRGSRRFIDRIFVSDEEGRERHRLETSDPTSNRFRGRSTIDFDFSLKFLYVVLSPGQLKHLDTKKEKKAKNEMRKKQKMK